MTTRRVPLCQTKGCPHPSDPDWHKPWCQDIKGHRCFGGATHQHIPKKGMGGHNPESEIVACLCAGAHDKIDNGPWGNAVLDIPGVGRVYRIWDVRKKPPLLERIIEAAPEGQALEAQGQIEESILDPPTEPKRIHAEPCSGLVPAVKESQENLPGPREALPTDLTQYSDEQLATLFAWADRQQKDSFLTKCQVVHAYRERHVQHWGGTWLEHAYDLFEGAPSRRTLEAYAGIWTCVTSDAYLLEHIGPLTDSRNLMQFIGRKNPEDGRIALETAVAHYAQFAEPPTEAALRHKLGEESKPDLCPKTGMPHDWQRVCKDCGKER